MRGDTRTGRRVGTALVVLLAAGMLTGAAPALGTVVGGPAAARNADPVPPHPPSPLAGLPTDVRNGQVVTLDGGDRFAVTRSAGGRTIRGRRLDAASGAWSEARTIFSDPDLRCWNVRARGSGTGVAVRFECGPALVEPDEGHPYAAATADTVRWQARRLPGWLWHEPAIAPAGGWSVWLRGRDYVTWSPTTGFRRHRTSLPASRAEHGQAPVVSDEGSVTIAWAERTTCDVTFDTYAVLGPPTRQVVHDPRVCEETMTGVDSRTVLAGDPNDPWRVSRLARADEASPWAVVAIAPLDAPGLLRDSLRPGLAPTVLDAPDRPLTVVANRGPDLTVQLYDPAAGSWLPPVAIHSRPGGARCLPRDDATPYVGFPALPMRCAGVDRLVTSTDGEVWQALPLRSQMVGRNDRLDLVAVPDRDHTVVLSRGSAPVVLPVGAGGRCDAFFPVATDRVLRLTATAGSREWPALLQRSTPHGWRTVRRLRLPHRGTCRRVFPGASGGADLQLTGHRQALGLRFVHRGGRWDVRRLR